MLVGGRSSVCSPWSPAGLAGVEAKPQEWEHCGDDGEEALYLE